MKIFRMGRRHVRHRTPPMLATRQVARWRECGLTAQVRRRHLRLRLRLKTKRPLERYFLEIPRRRQIETSNTWWSRHLTRILMGLTLQPEGSVHGTARAIREALEHLRSQIFPISPTLLGPVGRILSIAATQDFSMASQSLKVMSMPKQSRTRFLGTAG